MHAVTRQHGHADHSRHRRIIAQKLESREATLGLREPQFGGFGRGGNGRGNGNGGGRGRVFGNGGFGNGNGNGNGNNNGNNGGNNGGGNNGGGNNGGGDNGGGNNGGGDNSGGNNGGGDNGGGNNGGGDNSGGNNGGGDNSGGSTPQPSTSNSPVNNPPSTTRTSSSTPASASTTARTGNGGNSSPAAGSGSGSGSGSGNSDEGSDSGTSTSRTSSGQSSTTVSSSNTSATSSANSSGSSVGSGGAPRSSDLPPVSETGTGSPLITGAAKKDGLHAGAIAGIVLTILLFFILLLILLVRRRWVSRRRDRMQKWWFTHNRASQNFDEKPISPVFNEKALPATPRAAEASSFDMRAASPLDLANIMLPVPPSAEVRDHHGTMGHYTQANPDRLSIGSANAGTTESECSQFIILRNPLRPGASDNESFKFPKPPATVPTEAPSIHSRTGSGHSGLSYNSSVAAACGAGSGSASSLPGPSSLSRPPLTAPPPPPPLKIDVIPNPFIDPGQSSASTISNPFGSTDDDHALGVVGNFQEIETIARPYKPTLSDELAVTVGERVRVLEVFNDGWATVEKPGNGNADPARGLVPLACFREETEDLSRFLNTKRVQSFHVAKQTVE